MSDENNAPPVVAGDVDGLIERLHAGWVSHEDAERAADALAALQAEIARLQEMEMTAVVFGEALVERDEHLSAAQARNAVLTEALSILQAALTAKKPIPLPFKKAILDAQAALKGGENE
jgi:hypothetical protein